MNAAVLQSWAAWSPGREDAEAWRSWAVTFPGTGYSAPARRATGTIPAVELVMKTSSALAASACVR